MNGPTPKELADMEGPTLEALADEEAAGRGYDAERGDAFTQGALWVAGLEPPDRTLAAMLAHRTGVQPTGGRMERALDAYGKGLIGPRECVLRLNMEAMRDMWSAGMAALVSGHAPEPEETEEPA